MQPILSFSDRLLGLQRVVSGVIGAFCVLSIVFLGSDGIFCLLVSAAATGAAYEYFKITGNGRVSLSGFTGLLLTPLVPPLFLFFPYHPVFALTVSFVVLTLCKKVLRGPVENTPLSKYKTSIFGFLYIAPLLSHFVTLKGMDNGSGAVFFVLMTVWMSDSVAFYSGKKYGKRKLAPRVSPGKTVVGALGGIAGGIVGALIVSFTCFPEMSTLGAVLGGTVTGVSGQIGDLAESVIKREWRVKDSGSVIPGHGGLLDRLDSLFFAGPAFSLFLYVNQTLSF